MKLHLVGIIRRVFIIFFLIGFPLMIFGYVSGRYAVGPHRYFADIIEAYHALDWVITAKLLRASQSANEIEVPADAARVTPGAVSYHPDKISPGYTFISLFQGGVYGLILIDRDGTIKHRWQIPYRQAGLVTASDDRYGMDEKNRLIHGAHMYPNGDVVASVEYTGLVKIDVNSRLLWSLVRPTHHSVAIDSDGTIWTLSRKFIDSAQEAKPHIFRPYIDDEILHVSANGEILEECSILDIIFRNQYEGILYGGHPGKPNIDHNDPLHTNDINILSASQAQAIPNVAPGDLMISMRTIDTIMIIGRHDHVIKWCQTGPFLRQHDPDFDEQGNLWIYDNRTSIGQRNFSHYMPENRVFGYSRILKMDPRSRQILWQYQGTAAEPFYSSIQGQLQPLPNGNVLVAEPEGGRVFEIEPGSKQMVWSYVNVVGERNRGRVSDAFRYPLAHVQF